MPMHTILPLRFTSECKSCIRLWVGDGHCMALFDEKSQPLVTNIFDQPVMLQDSSSSSSRSEEEEDSEESESEKEDNK